LRYIRGSLKSIVLKLFMVLLGCKPAGRHTEQHDVFFGIGETIKDMVPQFIRFWPEAKGKLHVDGWREVNVVDGFQVEVQEAAASPAVPFISHRLFFINLGGYKENELEEFHYKMLAVATDKSLAMQNAKQTAFYKHTGFKGAPSHIDDKYGVDVDDVYAIEDILSEELKRQYRITLAPASGDKTADAIQLGYYPLNSL
jgi:hypothetical protein